jgi:hypothetical protein
MHILVKVLKVLRVQLVVHLGHVGWPLEVQLVPVDACEEGVCLQNKTQHPNTLKTVDACEEGVRLQSNPAPQHTEDS